MKQKLLRGIFVLISLFLTQITIAQRVFINEIHYDNDGGDANEGIEIAGPAGTDLSSYSLVLYNGSNNEEYATQQLSGEIPNLQGGFGAIFFAISGLQNGSPDGVALVNGSNVIQFLSYEGTINAVSGVASGLNSTDIGVEEGPATPIGFSLQLAGTGQVYTDFSWQPEAQQTYNAVNNKQDFGGEAPPVSVLINEVDADTEGTDTAEFLELYDGGVGNTPLDGKSLVFYNGSNNQSYATYDLTGYSTNAEGYFVLGNEGVKNVSIIFPSNGLQNGADGVALYEAPAENFPNGSEVSTENLIDAFVYGTNDANDAELLVLLNEGQPQVNEDGEGDKDAQSSQRYPNGEGGLRNTTAYIQALPTPGAANSNLTEAVNLVINELDADTQGTDDMEFLELFDGGTGNTPLDGFIVVLYNGNSDSSYDVFDLSGYSTHEDGYFVIGNSGVENVDYLVSSNTFQNGADAVAIYKDDASNFPSGSPITLPNLVDAIVYGTGDETDSALLVLLNDGQLQLDEDAEGDKDAQSLQRSPNGEGGTRNTESFIVDLPSPGEENGAAPVITEVIPIAQARNAAEGTTVTITGTLTVSDQFAGSAYIQDKTGAIAVFDNAVHGEGAFKIGDSLTLTGTRSSFNNQQQISPVTSLTFNGVAKEPIQPKEISLAELSEHPGELVKITNASFPSPGDLLFGNSNYNLTDASGTAELRIDADVEGLVGKAEPDTCTEILGVVGKFNEFYQLLPRLKSDLPCAEDYVPTGEDIDIPKDETIDVVTWNIEWFGDESNSPAAGEPNSDEIQKEAVKSILLRLNADVYGVEEISDDALFAQMVSEMEGYDYILSEATSYPGTPGAQKVGFIYKTETVQVISSRPLLASAHPFYNGGDTSYLTDYPEDPDRFFASGRLPFLMKAKVTINGQTKQIDFIDLHARANSGSGAKSRYDMRKYDVEALKDTLDTYFSQDNLVLVGDYNDDVDETVADVNTTISTYQEYVQDTASYNVLTSILSEEGFRSYVFNNDVIDHITVSNELEKNFVKGSSRVHYEFYSSDYSTTASDHFPVSTRLQIKAKDLSLVSIEKDDEICKGAENGSASINVEGGVTPYTYLWSDGQTTQTASNLAPGVYTVTVTDAVGNTLSQKVEIGEGITLTAEISENQKVYLGYTNTTCTIIEVSHVAGGSGSYRYLWNTGETTQQIHVCPEETTTYSVEVTDKESGCSITKSASVEVEDVSCGTNPYNPKVQICFKGRTKCVSKNAVAALLRAGASLGSCENGKKQIVEEISASPNPTRGRSIIHISASENVNASLVVMSLSGNTVINDRVRIRKGSNEFAINLSRFSQGIYMVKIEGSGFQSELIKVIKY